MGRGGVDSGVKSFCWYMDWNMVQFRFVFRRERKGDCGIETRVLGTHINHVPRRDFFGLHHVEDIECFFAICPIVRYTPGLTT